MSLTKEDSGPVRSDSGLFHLTARGWIRKDFAPYPPDRVETWKYDMEQPHPDTKELAHLTRIWVSAEIPNAQLEDLRRRFGDALTPTADRHLTLDCRA
jgi:hypothetical protein